MQWLTIICRLIKYRLFNCFSKFYFAATKLIKQIYNINIHINYNNHQANKAFGFQ